MSAMVETMFGGNKVLSYPGPPASEHTLPQTISRAQGKVALIEAGLWEAAEAFVASIADDKQRAFSQVALYDTTDWKRDSEFLNAAADALGLKPEQLDALFARAAQVRL